MLFLPLTLNVEPGTCGRLPGKSTVGQSIEAGDKNIFKVAILNIFCIYIYNNDHIDNKLFNEQEE